MQYKFIETLNDLNDLNDKLASRECIIFTVPESFDVHPSNCKISVFFVKDIEYSETFVFPVNHSEFDSNVTYQNILDVVSLPKKIFTLDSKKNFHIFGSKNFVDVNLLSYISDLEILDLTSTFHNKFVSFYKSKFQNLKCPNCFVPIGYFCELFETICDFCETTLKSHSEKLNDNSYKGSMFINQCLSEIESSGMFIDQDIFVKTFDNKFHSNITDGLLFSEYSLFTSTGRPSNKFGGINYAALNKKDDSRKCFISRFGDDGLLFDIDFQACHPHLISKLIGYDLPDGLNIYEYLGKFYFNKEELTSDEIDKSKTITFRQLYGRVEESYQDIPYFKKKIEYNNLMMDFFNTNGYIETPLFKRKMDNKNFGEGSAEKMFAYLLQSYETEVNLLKSRKILDILSNYRSRLVLYTYDSFLIDFCKDEPSEILIQIKESLEEDGMPVSIKAGLNYKDLKKITI